MMKLTSICATGVLCTIGALTSHAQTLTCENAQYDPALVQKYPNLPKSCFDIVSRDGENYAVVKAKLDKVLTNNSIQVRIKRPDGSYAPRTTVRTEAGQRVLIGGQPTRLSDVATGQEITAYVSVREPIIALEPVEESVALVTSPLEEEPERMAALPSTGSFTPVLALLGSISLLFGGLLTAIRIRRR
jgi:LPXTG-motif cell wall-anchored protein